MNKVDFILEMHERLERLPEEDVEKSIDYYCEMIDDRMEDGMSEEEAVASLGDVSEIVSQIIEDIPFAKIAKERMTPKRGFKVWEIVLLVLGSPIWLSLMLAFFAVVLSLYVSLWVIVASLWAVFASFVACAFSFLVGGAVLAITTNVYAGIVMIGASFLCGGLSIFMFYLCKILSKGVVILTKKLALFTKNCFVKKEVAR